ncbi:MAG: SelT/SelW/SelH family protein [Euzebyales bacterium]|nr:SelT/SelW/SelH family protein [Euzebyales bacterium]
MAAELLAEHGYDIAELTLVPSGGGVFEVDVDGELVYSKKATGRHAEAGEVLAAVRERLG